MKEQGWKNQGYFEELGLARQFTIVWIPTVLVVDLNLLDLKPDHRLHSRPLSEQMC